MSEQEQLDWINRNKDDLPPEAAGAIRPDVQERIANDVADDIKDPDDVDADTVKLLGFLEAEPAFAHQLYTEVSPDELGDAAGVTFATFTKGGPGGTYAPPPDLVDTYFNAITDKENPENAGALTLLIRHGGAETSLDPEFLTELTGKVYEWERGHDGDPVWGPLNESMGGYEYGIKDPDLDYGEPDDDGYDDQAFGKPALDGLANLLGGMENSPDAANAFFHGRYDGSEQTLDERMHYLVGGGDGRTWDGADGSDDGDGLGKALQAATVGHDQRTEDGTEIANALFHNIAEYGGEGDSTFDNNWHVGPNMTDSLGTIASGYSGDIYEMLRNSDPDNGALSLDISNKELTDVLGEIGGSDDKTGLETLTTSMLLQCRNENTEYLHDLEGPHNLSAIEASGYLGVQQANGDVMGNLTHYGTELAADNDKTAEARAALVSKAISVAGNFIPGGGTVIGEGASELAKMTYDTVKSTSLSEISDAVKEAAPSSAAEFRDSAEADLPRQMTYNSLSDLYRTHFLDQQETPTGTYEGIDPILFQGDPPTLRPELFDSDGNDLPADLPDREKIKQAWNEYTDSNAYPVVNKNTYTENFYTKMQNPTPLEGM